MLLNWLGSRDIISPFNCPSNGALKPKTVKWLLCTTPEQIAVYGLLFNESVKQNWIASHQQNMLWFFSCTSCVMDNCLLNGNSSWKICDSHVFRLQRRWHKTLLPCDLLDFYKSEVWLQDVAEISLLKKRGSWYMRTRPEGPKEESIKLSFSDVEFMFL